METRTLTERLTEWWQGQRRFPHQTAFAKWAGIDRTTLGKMFKGGRFEIGRLKPETRGKLAEATGISDFLLPEDGGASPLAQETKLKRDVQAEPTRLEELSLRIGQGAVALLEAAHLVARGKSLAVSSEQRSDTDSRAMVNELEKRCSQLLNLVLGMTPEERDVLRIQIDGPMLAQTASLIIAFIEGEERFERARQHSR